jgi:hypothetical protein
MSAPQDIRNADAGADADLISQVSDSLVLKDATALHYLSGLIFL